jgi:tetratricopeptide (TPR) repeat protein
MDRIEKLNDMLRLHPEDAFLRHALGLEYVKKGEDGKARALFSSILENDPDYVGTYYHLAALLIRNGEKEEAIKLCETGLAACKRAADDHAWRELNSVYEDLIY